MQRIPPFVRQIVIGGFRRRILHNVIRNSNPKYFDCFFFRPPSFTTAMSQRPIMSVMLNSAYKNTRFFSGFLHGPESDPAFVLNSPRFIWATILAFRSAIRVQSDAMRRACRDVAFLLAPSDLRELCFLTPSELVLANCHRTPGECSI